MSHDKKAEQTRNPTKLLQVAVTTPLGFDAFKIAFVASGTAVGIG